MIIEVPNGISAQVKGNEITIKGSLGTNTRIFNDELLHITASGNKIEITPTSEKVLAKKAADSVNSVKKEILNDLAGVNEYFEKRMAIVFAHFPITAEANGKVFLIKNMLGERAARKAKIVGATKVEVKGQEVRVYGSKLDDVAQTAANIRTACRIRKKDGRVFQDGIYYALK